MPLKNDDKEDDMMHVKTMEGLIGARTNMELMDTPMRVYRAARRKGDTETMGRAMGYANECSEKAEEYKAEADEGMKKDAEETRKLAEARREEAIQKRREERERLEERIEENRNVDSNTDATTATTVDAKETGACLLEISEEGKVLLKDNADFDSTGTGSDEMKTDAVKAPVTYTKTGETVPVEQKASISVSV